MKQNVKIAKELVKLAKSLVATNVQKYLSDEQIEKQFTEPWIEQFHSYKNEYGMNYIGVQVVFPNVDQGGDFNETKWIQWCVKGEDLEAVNGNRAEMIDLFLNAHQCRTDAWLPEKEMLDIKQMAALCYMKIPEDNKDKKDKRFHDKNQFNRFIGW